MKNYLLSISIIFALAISAIGQTTLLDFETVTDPFIEPFDVTSYASAVANPDGDGSVGQVVKAGWAFWGGINVYFGGDITFTGTDDKFTVDFYTEDAGVNDSILFRFQLFNRYGNDPTIEVDAYYTEASDTEVGAWKTLEFALPDGTTGVYNQMVIFFGMNYSSDGDTYYFDNVVAPGFTAYGATDVTFNITDKFNNASDVKLFIDGAAATLTQDGNVYSNTSSLAAYNITVGESTGTYEIVLSHMANGVEVRDTTSLLSGSTTGAQEVVKLIIVEALEDGTALAISVGDTPPVIDGTIDAIWDNAKTHTLQERSWWGASTGMYSTYKVMWDIDNIYLLYVIEDATPTAVNTTDTYKNDCMETFFDMNQSAATPFDADDWQIRVIRNSDLWTGSANVTDDWATDVESAQTEMAEGAGYVIELAIPWTSLSATFLPIVGTEFNFDCSAADVTADGGTRVYRESWTTARDVAYMNTEDYGTLTLSDKTIETAVKNREVTNVTVFPNPATDMVSIRSDVEISSISIVDITGRTVSTLKSIRDFNTIVNVGHLTDGIYLINISDVKGGSSVQKLRVL